MPRMGIGKWLIIISRIRSLDAPISVLHFVRQEQYACTNDDLRHHYYLYVGIIASDTMGENARAAVVRCRNKSDKFIRIISTYYYSFHPLQRREYARRLQCSASEILSSRTIIFIIFSLRFCQITVYPWLQSDNDTIAKASEYYTMSNRPILISAVISIIAPRVQKVFFTYKTFVSKIWFRSDNIENTHQGPEEFLDKYKAQ